MYTYISSILPKKIDKYNLCSVEYLESCTPHKVNIYIKSTTTGRIFCEEHFVSKGTGYSKTAIKRMLSLFIPQLESTRITYSTKGFQKINQMYRNTEVELTYHVKPHSNRRTNIQKSILNKQVHPTFGLSNVFSDIYELQQALLDRLPNDVEYRHFYEPNRSRINVIPMYREIHRYNLPPTRDTYYLCTLHFRGNDTLYFIAYNTSTQEYYYETDWLKIKKFVLSLDHLIIMSMIDLYYLECVVNSVDIKGKPIRYLYKSLREIPRDKRLYLNAISVQDMLSKFDKPNYVAEKCYPYMRTGVYGSETKNCEQSMENLKRIFDTELRQHLLIRKTLLDNIKHSKSVNEKDFELMQRYSFSKLIDILLYNEHTSKYQYSLDNLIDTDKLSPRICDFLSNKANIEAYGDDLKRKKDVGELTLRDLTLKIGSTGFGGLHGSLEEYLSNKDNTVYHIDFQSMYPTILLATKKLDAPIDLSIYKSMYTKKFNSTNELERLTYKRSINVLIGILNSSKDLNCKAPDIWKAIVKLGQFYMLLLLHTLSKNKHFKILNVNTDGVYVEVPKTYVFDSEELLKPLINYGFQFSVSRYNRVYIKNSTSILIDVNGVDYIAKGDFKRCGCNYILNCIVAKQLRGEDYSTVPYTEQDLFLLDTISNERYLMCSKVTSKGTEYDFSKFKIDTYEPNYIQNFNSKYNVDINVDLSQYWKRADSFILNDELQ